MSDELITKALQTHLKTFADAQTPKLAIAYEGVAFTMDATKPHLAEYTLPAETQNPSIGRDHARFIGTYQVDVDTPAGSNVVALRKLANSLAAHFKRGTVCTNSTQRVLVLQTPSISPIITGDGRMKRAVSIRYQSDVFAT